MTDGDALHDGRQAVAIIKLVLISLVCTFLSAAVSSDRKQICIRDRYVATIRNYMYIMQKFGSCPRCSEITVCAADWQMYHKLICRIYSIRRSRSLCSNILAFASSSYSRCLQFMGFYVSEPVITRHESWEFLTNVMPVYHQPTSYCGSSCRLKLLTKTDSVEALSVSTLTAAYHFSSP